MIINNTSINNKNIITIVITTQAKPESQRDNPARPVGHNYVGHSYMGHNYIGHNRP